MPASVPTAPPWPEPEIAKTSSIGTAASVGAASQNLAEVEKLAAQIGLTPPAKPGEALDLGFICSLTLEVFEDPVQASDGHT